MTIFDILKNFRRLDFFRILTQNSGKKLEIPKNLILRNLRSIVDGTTSHKMPKYEDGRELEEEKSTDELIIPRKTNAAF